MSNKVLLFLIAIFALTILVGCSQETSSIDTRPDKTATKTNTEESSGTDNASETNDAIVVRDGETGEVGETMRLDGEDYIFYHFTPGKYNVTLTEMPPGGGTVWVDENEMITNSSGYSECVLVKRYDFKAIGETQTVVIPQGTHVEVTINTAFKFVEVK